MKIHLPLSLLLVFLLGTASNSTAQKEKEILWTAEWSPNGKNIAIGGNTDSLNIYSADLKTHTAFPVAKTITRVAWHPTQNVIAVATQVSSEASFILNLDTKTRIPLSGLSPDGARGLAWNYTGEYLALADNDGRITIYTSKGERLRSFANQVGSTKGVTALAWHPKKNILITVSDQIRVLDSDGKLLKTIKHRAEEVMLLSVAWHPSGEFFVTGDYGDVKDASLLQYWSEEGTLLQSSSISKGEYRNLAWNAKGNRLASASDALRIWDSKGKLLSEGSSPDYLWGISWNPKGNTLITSSMLQRITLWNAKAKKYLSLE
ncbi:MAG: hypothetical protein RLZZ543_759 [Bacteroidota bacterium]|jgi:WD40 repeat protein